MWQLEQKVRTSASRHDCRSDLKSQSRTNGSGSELLCGSLLFIRCGVSGVTNTVELKQARSYQSNPSFSSQLSTSMFVSCGPILALHSVCWLSLCLVSVIVRFLWTTIFLCIISLITPKKKKFWSFWSSQKFYFGFDLTAGHWHIWHFTALSFVCEFTYFKAGSLLALVGVCSLDTLRLNLTTDRFVSSPPLSPVILSLSVS